jgi:signal peptidase I
VKANHLTLGFLMLATIACGCRKSNVVSASMAPTIKPGEKVVIDYTAYSLASPKQWDVVAFEPLGKSNELWVFRVAGLPGDQIDFRDEMLLVNSNPVVLPSYVTNVQYRFPTFISNASTLSFPYFVPANSYFLLGDNSSNANDSRIWGAIPKGNILGKVKGK